MTPDAGTHLLLFATTVVGFVYTAVRESRARSRRWLTEEYWATQDRAQAKADTAAILRAVRLVKDP